MVAGFICFFLSFVLYDSFIGSLFGWVLLLLVVVGFFSEEGSVCVFLFVSLVVVAFSVGVSVFSLSIVHFLIAMLYWGYGAISLLWFVLLTCVPDMGVLSLYSI